jgi:hypothetical protein
MTPSSRRASWARKRWQERRALPLVRDAPASATPTPALMLLIGGAGGSVWAAGEILAGYAAKTLCTCVFVAGREEERR